MRKYRFIIVGSGWRSLYYVRVAKALPEQFELCAMLCRTEEKAERLAAEQKIITTTSIEECVSYQPDLVVVAVNKRSIAEVVKEWLARGFAVLCETPVSMEPETMRELWELHRRGAKLVVAEQYNDYPFYYAARQAIAQGWIGEPHSAVVSLAHEYHGASLIRGFLGEGMTPFTVCGQDFSFPAARVRNRYEQFSDGNIEEKKRTAAVFAFADGKVGFYDFDGDQYRSPIRRNYLDIRGPRGELQGGRVYYLDEENQPRCEKLKVSRRIVEAAGEENPNLRQIEEITEIRAEKAGIVLYRPSFSGGALAQDETAVAEMMYAAAVYGADGTFPKDVMTGKFREPQESLRNALQDCYMAMMLKKALKTGETIESEPQPWHV